MVALIHGESDGVRAYVVKEEKFKLVRQFG